MTVVGVDVSAIPSDPRGAGRYVVELVRALDARHEVELRLEARKDDGERWQHLAPRAQVRPVVPASKLRRLAWEQIAAPRFVDRWGIDVLHAPHYTMPEVAKVPKVVTIHDLTFFDRPELHERVKVSFFSRAIKVAAKLADALVCVSAPTARRLEELLEPKAPVHVIPHGVDHDTFRPDDPAGDDERLLSELGVRGRYLAFVGTLEPRKNVSGLVQAFDRLAGSKEHDDVTLVIAGGSGWGNEAFERALAASPAKDRIIRTGYVAQEALPALMRHAEAVVYPALEEGFGLPVLEALACGTTAITTADSVMDEIAEGAAVAIPGGDVEALANALRARLERGPDSDRRERGLAVARRYTWDACAAAHEAVYRATAR
ncbi:MAG TPA: glycosyltransferase family 1 protein [Acidimicrobiales bacterium]|jgi:glycosyltransferase involved in cell wall biosynthesis|nr:glycosyltransferase family 1 protein [Acidimicrobiales bacterium]